jgi:hypothetical protein
MKAMLLSPFRFVSQGECLPAPLKKIGVLLLMVLSGFQVGCFSPGFNRAWRDADAGSGGGTRWEGRWESQRPGTGGRLRAVVRSEAEGHVRTYFEAHWKCFVGAYEVSLKANKAANQTFLSGEHDLKSCVGGGLYTYRGTLSSGELRAEYHSHHDSGVFVLKPAASGTK